MAIKAFAPVLVCLALAACESSGYKRSPVVTPQIMSCSGGQPAQVTLYSPDEAKLVFEGKSYMLDRVATASGVKYANKSISFWNKGIDAMIIRPDDSITTCTYIPKGGL